MPVIQFFIFRPSFEVDKNGFYTSYADFYEKEIHRPIQINSDLRDIDAMTQGLG
jgi:hypothetical protein